VFRVVATYLSYIRDVAPKGTNGLSSRIRIDDEAVIN
jgi:hypothetical protein